MSRHCLTLISAVALFAMPALTTNALEIRGIAPAACSVTLAQPNPAASSASRYLPIEPLIDLATRQLKPASIFLSLNAMCNHAHTLSTQSRNGGLQITQRAASQVASPIDYSATARWGVWSSRLQTTGIAGQYTEDALTPPFRGRLHLQITVSPDGANRVPLLLGGYQDTLVIRFKPGKYPPAKPGALDYEPLKAAAGDADAAPNSMSRLKADSQFHKHN